MRRVAFLLLLLIVAHEAGAVRVTTRTVASVRAALRASEDNGAASAHHEIQLALSKLGFLSSNDVDAQSWSDMAALAYRAFCMYHGLSLSDEPTAAGTALITQELENVKAGRNIEDFTMDGVDMEGWSEDSDGNHEVSFADLDPAHDDVHIPRWDELQPPLLTLDDLRAELGRKTDEPLDKAEVLVLHFTNEQISNGKPNTNLKENLSMAIQWRAPQVGDEEARMLDGVDFMQPLEAATRDYTNQNILVAGPDVDLKRNYWRFVNQYRDDQAAGEAATLFDAMDGWGTDEAAVMRVIAGKTRDQIVVLSVAFEAHVRTHDRGDYDDGYSGYGSLLERWIDGEFDHGWLTKATDALAGREVKEDAHYHYSSRAAKWVNEVIKSSDRGAKEMIEHGNLFEQGIGYFNQAILGTAKFVNENVSYAQEFYAAKIDQSESGVFRSLCKTGFVLASIGGSLGTKAFDPTLPYDKTEEGLFDLAMLVIGGGAGKLLAAASKTAVGARVLEKLGSAFARLSHASYAIRHAVGLTSSATRLEALALKYTRIASNSVKNSARADAARVAGQKYRAASEAAMKADNALVGARMARAQLDKLMKSTTDVSKLADEVANCQKLADDARVALNQAADAHAAAKEAGRAAGVLKTSMVGQRLDALKMFLKTPVGQRVALMRKVSKAVDPSMAQVATANMRSVLKTLDGATGEMTGAQFNAMMDKLRKVCAENGVTIGRRAETMGVFPDGLYKFDLAGFDKMTDLAATVNFAKRHELAHILHVTQMRITLINTVKSGRITRAEATAFLNNLESGGASYRQLEKMVTTISGAGHRSKRAKDVALWAERSGELTRYTEKAMLSGKVRFPTSWGTPEGVYAHFLSKAPAVVGTGLKSLSLRFPFILFTTLYVLDMPVRAYGIEPEKWGFKNPHSVQGMRDFVKVLFSEGYHPAE